MRRTCVRSGRPSAALGRSILVQAPPSIARPVVAAPPAAVKCARAERTGVEYAPLQVGGNVALYFPIVALPPEQPTTNPPVHKRPRLAPNVDAELAERAQYESLRDLAVAHDVSHETVRAALRRRHQHDLAVLTGT